MMRNSLDESLARRDTAADTDVAPAHLLARQAEAWRVERRSILDELLQEAPELRDRPQLMLDLIQHEVGLRRQSGETPALEEYVARLPDLAEPLRVQWLINDVLSVGKFDGDARDPLMREGNFRIGRYEVERRLGHGGSGVVFKAWDPRLKRVVAIKLLRAGMRASDEDIARFQMEAEAIARVRHPQVVQIYDVGRADGESYLAMEYCDQGSLADRLDGSPLEPRHAASLLLSVTEAVAAAHATRVVHRDLKPGNIFLVSPEVATPSTTRSSPEPLSNLQVKVSDFGLAKLLDDDSEQTRTGMILGTPMYMAPEQAFGRGATAGPAVDIHALGAILYELLTGRPPFRGATPIETLDLVRHQEPLPPRQLNPRVPLDLETLVLRCLQKDPARRYATAEAVAEDLRRFLDGRPILARRISARERLWRWVQRNPRVAALLASIAALLLLLAGGAMLSAVVLKHQRDLAVKAERQRRQELYRAHLLESQSTRVTFRGGSREGALNTLRSVVKTIPRDELSPEQFDALRDAGVAALARVDFRAVERRRAPAKMHVGVDLDPTFRSWAYDSPQRGTICEWQTDAGAIQDEAEPFLGADSSELRLRKFSHDGRWLVVIHSGSQESGMRAWDVREKRWGPTVKVPHHVREYDIDSQNRLFASCGDDRIRVWRLPSLELLDTSPPRFEHARIAVRSDGKQLVFASPLDQFAQWVDTQTWETLGTITEAGLQPATVHWSPRHDHVIVFVTERGQVLIWDPTKRRGRIAIDYHQDRVVRAAMSPAADLFASSDSLGQTIVRSLWSGEVVAKLEGQVIRFDETSTQLALAVNDELVVHRLEGGAQHRLTRDLYNGCQFAPDGEWLMTGGPLGPRVYSTNDLQRRDEEGFQLDTCGAPAFARDGQELVTFGLFSKIHRWPLQKRDDEPRGWEIGPARPVDLSSLGGFDELRPQHRGWGLAFTPDGRELIAADFRNRRVVALDTAEQRPPRVVGELLNVERVAVSPDGRWISGGAVIYPKVRIWSSDGGPVVHEIPDAQHAAFSDDGRFLVTSTLSHVRILEVGTWRVHRELPCAVVHALATPVIFLPHSHVVAFAPNAGIIQLFDVSTNRVVANLAQPERMWYWSLAASPDGRRLAYTTTDELYLGMWDLAELWKGLEDLGLKAPLPSVRPHGDRPVSTNTEPPSFTIQRGEALPDRSRWSENWLNLADREILAGRPPDAIGNADRALQQASVVGASELVARVLTARAEYHSLNGNLHAARTDWQKALELTPDSSDSMLALARSYLLGLPNEHDGKRGVSLVAPLVYREQPHDHARTLLGIAQYRLGNPTAAASTLREVLAAREDVLARYFLALSLLKLGKAAEAHMEVDSGQQAHRSLPWDMRVALRRQFDEARREAEEALAEARADMAPGR